MSQTDFTEELASITRQIEMLHSENARLQAEVAQLRANQGQINPTQTLSRSNQPTRRKLLKQLFAVTAGAVTASALATTTGEVKAAGVGTVTGSSTPIYGFTASPNGVATYIPTRGTYGLIGITTQDGINVATLDSAGVLGYSNDDFGVFGNSTNSSGIVGFSINSAAVVGSSGRSIGVLGIGSTHGVIGESDTIGTGGKFRGAKAALVLEPSAATSIPTTGVHNRGEFVVTNESGDNTNLYFSIHGNDTDAGKWVRLNQPYTAGTNVTISPRNADGTFTISAASNVVFLPGPLRLAASTNSGGSLPLLTSNGSGNPNTTFQSIQITGANIPANAKGIIGSITSVEATKAGGLKIWASGTTAPIGNTLTIPSKSNNSAGIDLTTAFTIGLGTSGKVNLGYSNRVAGSTCGFALDVVAYIL